MCQTTGHTSYKIFEGGFHRDSSHEYEGMTKVTGVGVGGGLGVVTS